MQAARVPRASVAEGRKEEFNKITLKDKALGKGLLLAPLAPGASVSAPLAGAWLSCLPR